MPQKKSGSPRKRTTGPRIALRLPVRAEGLYTRCVASWDAIKADPVHFGNPYPPAPEVDKDLSGLATALSAAAGGDPVAAAALFVAVAKVRGTWALMGKYVESVVRAGPIEDAPALIASVLMYESQVGKRAPKPELQARQGPTSGIALLVARAVPRALVYTYEYSLDQVTWTLAGQSGKTRFSIAGLTPGKTYYFRSHAFTSDDVTTELSQVVSFMLK